jgi:hypothetical protein
VVLYIEISTEARARKDLGYGAAGGIFSTAFSFEEFSRLARRCVRLRNLAKSFATASSRKKVGEMSAEDRRFGGLRTPPGDEIALAGPQTRVLVKLAMKRANASDLLAVHCELGTTPRTLNNINLTLCLAVSDAGMPMRRERTSPSAHGPYPHK